MCIERQSHSMTRNERACCDHKNAHHMGAPNHTFLIFYVLVRGSVGMFL